MKFKELEKQSIYFAPASVEDDMYEGRYPMYFDGNEALWQGFFAMFYKHISFNQGIVGEKFDEYVPAMVPLKTNLTSRNYNYDGEEFKGYLNIGGVRALIALFAASGKVYERQLRKIITQYILFLTIFYSQQFGAFVNKKTELEKKNKQMVKKLDSVQKIISTLNKVPCEETSRVDILSKFTSDPLCYQNELDVNSQQFVNYQISEKLMDSFFEGLRNMALENCYIASFTDDYSDGRMWHDYTNYEGIAIEYKNDESITLRDSEGNSSNHKFKKVAYENAQSFNFFSSIGKLPDAMITGIFANYDWGNDTHQIKENLKDNYWKWTEKTVLTKDSSWITQRESRLIISNFMEGYSTTQSRTFFYDFSELKSITFGPKTSNENKIKITKILVQKCKENDVANFPVYAMFRDDKTGKMERELLTSLHGK